MLNRLSLIFIRFYQFVISPILPPRCRFYPTCSEYSLQCFQRFSFLKALWYSLFRIIKCQPFHPGGNDPVPPYDAIKARRRFYGP